MMTDLILTCCDLSTLRGKIPESQVERGMAGAIAGERRQEMMAAKRGNQWRAGAVMAHFNPETTASQATFYLLRLVVKLVFVRQRGL